MSRRWLLITGTVALVLAVGVWQYLGPAGSSSANHKTKLTQALVVADGHDTFGEVWESKYFAWSFPVVNRSEHPVAVEKVTGSCTCLAVSPQRFTIQPGQTQSIAVRIDFTAKPRSDENAAFALQYQGSSSLGGSITGEWYIAGKVSSFVTLNQPLDLGRHSVLAQPLKPVTVKVHFAAPVDNVTIEPVGPAIRPSLSTQKSDRGIELAVHFVAPLPIGRLNEPLRIRTRLASGECREDTLSLTGSIVPDVETSPPMYLGGGRLMGETFEFDVTVSSLTRSPFKVVSVKTTGEGLEVMPKEDRYLVRQHCRAAGPQSGRVEFVCDGPGGRSITAIPVEYLGFHP